MCRNCKHGMWEHEFIDESGDNLYFGKCEAEGCDCEQFEKGKFKG